MAQNMEKAGLWGDVGRDVGDLWGEYNEPQQKKNRFDTMISSHDFKSVS